MHDFHSPENPEKSQEKQMQVKKKPKKPEEVMIFLAISDNSSKIFIFRKYYLKNFCAFGALESLKSHEIPLVMVIKNVDYT